MTISIIAAVARNNAIGRDGGLPWRLPADLKYFKSRTMGHHVIMGRRTWEEIGVPLPGRTNIVVTRNPGFTAQGATVVGSLEEAMEIAKADLEVFVVGGAVIYELAIPFADRMYLTRIDSEFDADTFFPDFDRDEWELVEQEDHEPDERNRWPYSFTTWVRRRGA